MSTADLLRKKVAIKREMLRRKAGTNLLDFIYYTDYEYRANWHHKLICDEITAFFKDDSSENLMLFLPPQHGKSQIASRAFPAYALGIKPDLKIAACSYSIDLARSFNRDVQRIIDSREYREIFPGTIINSKKIVTTQSWLRNSEEFEVVNKRGSYKAVGVMGGLSGRRVDLAIIDDPVKDALEANSEVYRDRVWDWYVSVLQTRLHNKSKVVLIMTRWHEDDLAGRLLAQQSDKWEVIKIPAIKEVGESHPDDPRQPGEALWKERHTIEKLIEQKELNATAFESLYQQNPTTPGGNKIKEEWFEYCYEGEIPSGIIWNLWVDGAYTKQTQNDPTGLMIAGYHQQTNRMYVRHAHSALMEMPELLEFIPEYCDLHGIGNRSKVMLEPKASGKSLKQMLNRITKLSCVEIAGHLVQEGKEARIQTAAPKVQSGKVVLVRGSWNAAFVHQICAFPKVKHDEYVDLLGYSCFYHFDGSNYKLKIL